MRRRETATAAALPASLAVYAPDWRTLSAEQWEAGYDRWKRDRVVWARRHSIALDDLPMGQIGDMPFDGSEL